MSKNKIIELCLRQYSVETKNEIPRTNGVYCIYFKNLESNKIYIGSASSFKSKFNSGKGFYVRFCVHLINLRKKKHHSKKLQNAYNLYGEENMIFSILEECSPDKCVEIEQKYIDLYDVFNSGFNCSSLASSFLLKEHEQDAKNKISEKSKQKRNVYKDKVIEFYKHGKTTSEISKLIGIHKKTILKILKENDIKIKKRSDYIKNRIFQYDLNGYLIKSWDSILKCSKNTGILDSNIRRVLKKKCISAKGFYFDNEKMTQEKAFSKIEELKKEKKEISKKNLKKSFTKERVKRISDSKRGNSFRSAIKNIKQYDIDGNLIKVWNNTREIVNFYKLKNSSSIIRVLKGHRKKFKNFIWKT